MNRNIPHTDLRRDMMELWKATFHDSDRYIDIVFDAYFDPDNAFVRYHENRIIAALLGVAYEFQILTNEEKKSNLKGMYLCGLATHPDYRKRGIMSELMREAEEAASERGYDLSFLIPADNHLRDYYRRRGYRDASFRKEELFQATETGRIPSLNIYSIKDLFIRKHIGQIEMLAEWCSKRERDSDTPIMLHSRKDFIAAMTENENSIFLCDCIYDREYQILTDVAAVVFPELPDSHDKPVRVVGLFQDDHCANCKNRANLRSQIALALCEKYQVPGVEFLLPFCGEPVDDNVKPYAMVKKIRNHQLIDENESTIFKICLMLD